MEQGAPRLVERSGDERLSVDNGSKARSSAEGRSDTSEPKKAGRDGERTKGSKNGGESGALGRALKTVYDNTLREDVPQDFLDLLGKLS